MTRRTPRGTDKIIRLVACPCSFHLFDWRSKSFYARTPDGGRELVERKLVPAVCRASFGR